MVNEGEKNNLLDAIADLILMLEEFEQVDSDFSLARELAQQLYDEVENI